MLVVEVVVVMVVAGVVMVAVVVVVAVVTSWLYVCIGYEDFSSNGLETAKLSSD